MARRSDMWMPFYVADYLRDTMHLEAAEHGAYLLLIMACWIRGGRLPADEDFLARTAKVSRTIWRRKIGPLILPFFRQDEAGLYHQRVVSELEKARSLSATRTAAGAKGGRPKKPNGKQNETHAGASSPSPSPLPPEDLSQPPSESAQSSAFADDSALAYAMYGDPGAEEPERTPLELTALLPTPDPVRDAFEAYNKLAAELGLPIANALTDERRRKLKLRLNGTPDRWYRALDRLRASPWCHGYNDRRWRADLDFMLQPKSYQRLLEGHYTHLATTETRDGRPTPKSDSRLDNLRRAVAAPTLASVRRPT
jgi:uncharacterized protein YdaU (DUF1376 family)